MRVTRVVDDYLFAWVALSVVAGALFPAFGVVTRFSTPILAVMVGSVSLTLSASQFRAVDRSSLARILAAHVTVPLVGFALASGLGLPPGLTAGFVLLGAVTPELVAPTMTHLADGDTALAATALVVIGIGSTLFAPAAVAVLLGPTVDVEGWRIAESLLVAVVVPMVAAVAVRTRGGARVARYEEYYSSVSAVAVVVIIGGVTAANAQLALSNVDLLARVGAGALALNLVGYALGWYVSRGAPTSTRIASALSVGTRDFAVAAALPAVLFGVVEMVTSALLARRFSA